MLSLLLVLVMLLGMIPAITMPASAATQTVEVDTWDELEFTLNATSSVNIKLIGDIKHSHDAYTSGHTTTPITGTKTLDLNGYTILCEDKSNRQHYDDAYSPNKDHDIMNEQTKTLFEITEGSSLTLNDTKSKGKIRFEADFMGYTWGSYDDVHYGGYTHRDIFAVNGTLIVNSGTIEAGSVQKQYVCDGYGYEIGKAEEDHSRYDGNVRQQVWGKAVKVGKTGTLVVNGGTLTGRGSQPITFVGALYAGGGYFVQEKGFRSSVVTIAEGGKAYINGGSFYGNGGTNVFNGEKDRSNHAPVPEGSLTVRGGSFYTDKHDHIRGKDKNDHFIAVNYHATIYPGTYGNLGIPQEAYMDCASNLNVIMNGNTFTGASQIQNISLQITGENYTVEDDPKTSSYEYVLPETLKKQKPRRWRFTSLLPCRIISICRLTAVRMITASLLMAGI